MDLTFRCISHLSQRGWFSGRIVPCHGTDPGSIPGSRMCNWVFNVDIMIFSHLIFPSAVT